MCLSYLIHSTTITVMVGFSLTGTQLIKHQPLVISLLGNYQVLFHYHPPKNKLWTSITDKPYLRYLQHKLAFFQISFHLCNRPQEIWLPNSCELSHVLLSPPPTPYLPPPLISTPAPLPPHPLSPTSSTPYLPLPLPLISPLPLNSGGDRNKEWNFPSQYLL